jgi:hypothetical protein
MNREETRNGSQLTARREAARNRWPRRDSPGKTLPPPEKLADAQVRLINAARQGKAEFNTVWDEMFHGKKGPAPDPQSFLLSRQKEPRVLK